MSKMSYSPNNSKWIWTTARRVPTPTKRRLINCTQTTTTNLRRRKKENSQRQKQIPFWDMTSMLYPNIMIIIAWMTSKNSLAWEKNLTMQVMTMKCQSKRMITWIKGIQIWEFKYYKSFIINSNFLVCILYNLILLKFVF